MRFKVPNSQREGANILFKKKERWYLSKVGLGAFILGTILELIFGRNIYFILGLLTSAIILIITDMICVFYTKMKSTKEK